MKNKKVDPFRLPPEYGQSPMSAPPPEEFPPCRADAPLPPEFSAGAESWALPDEFSSGGGPGLRPQKKKKRGIYMVAALGLLVLMVLLPAVKTPADRAPAQDAPAATPGLDDVPSSVPPEDATEPAETTVPTETTAPTEPQTPSGLYLASVGGSYCVVSAELGSPETIAEARITLTDTNSGELFREEVFGAGIPRADIESGSYSTVFVAMPDDIRQYEADNGVGAIPQLEAVLTIIRTNGETESITAQPKGSGPSMIMRWYDTATNSVDITLSDSRLFTLAVNDPGAVTPETVSLSVQVNGQTVSTENCSVAYSTQQYETFTASGEPTGTVTYNESTVTAVLPQPLSESDRLSFTLELEIEGHRYTYTDEIRH